MERTRIDIMCLIQQLSTLFFLDRVPHSTWSLPIQLCRLANELQGPASICFLSTQITGSTTGIQFYLDARLTWPAP